VGAASTYFSLRINNWFRFSAKCTAALLSGNQATPTSIVRTAPLMVQLWLPTLMPNENCNIEKVE